VRVAYISPDFRGHPVAYAIAGVIKGHYRRRIEPLGVSLTAPDASDIGRELRAACDVLDCSAMTDRDVVRLLREREIDIAVDLAGFTAGARPALFAARVAPVQLNYLGFPSSTGAGYMDAMIADAIVVPEGDEHLVTERVLRLPHAYLPFDRSRSIATTRADRDACGLPSAGFVFCGFTNGYKLSRQVFDTWLTLLAEVPDSVLWLRHGPPEMAENLICAARNRGIAAERLVFAAFVERMDEHFARLRLADLMLDTAPYNAHTTTAEALWAGVPVITWRGRRFAGRVGASLLTAAGLPELVRDTLEGYRRFALHLARSPDALAALRARLAVARTEAALFDTQQYVRDFETILCALAQHP
jgi:predicted O-linked N-acetylglucosamine transferase (SPINDLY family)